MAEHVIKTTKDYDKFQVFKFNRPISEGLVKKIMESITQIGYTQVNLFLLIKIMLSLMDNTGLLLVIDLVLKFSIR